MKNRNIILVGFMGCGKTTIGCKIARWLDYKFVDIDKYIETLMRSSIHDIFRQYGESYFRILEARVIKKVSKWRNCCISTGGGSIINRNNIYYLKRSGTVIYLNVGFDRLYENIRNTTNRPLVNETIKKEQVELLFKERMPLYITCADVIIDSSELSIEECEIGRAHV